ncbi:MAG: endonuclease/exonuclease/phosphatase family protein [Candidatus Marinimicrobia bacterium]|nr:endonuclease/exonuclease/phosphatase family protein [Candidatus Neomarinimicrobiota bacterium]MBL7022948.1 endonuclease/exonuclease/phosphatase family protein [Candidatus Neomarinimicrobiota bacterium]MBL7108766.1 endonuclease/exonuclease/phosphatase family protein [Candidatus Neomarinimicrobiota bacterium]
MIFVISICFFLTCAENNPNGFNYINEELSEITPFGSDSTLDIITWNIENFPKQYGTTTDYLSKIIYELHVDILALQEIESSSYFDQLIDDINDTDSLKTWYGFRANSAGWNLNLAFIYTSEIDIEDISEIHSLDNDYLLRTPLMLTFSWNGNDICIINNHFKCCGNGTIDNYSDDEEFIRQQASISLKSYIDTYLQNENVIVLGDFNDEIQDAEEQNVFWSFIDDSDNFVFIDMEIAANIQSDWSYPTWPSHIDHILITNELFNEFENSSSDVQTILVDKFFNNWSEYDSYISDHRPVGLKLKFD